MEAGLHRKREELDSGIASIIQDKFTNIHPSVHWKFRDVAISFLKKKEQNNARLKPVEVDPITFENVYPLYGQADIVSSSLQRNKAIQADLLENLSLMEKTLESIDSYVQKHLLDYFASRIHSIKQEIQKSFSPSDETRVIELLRSEIHPCLRALQETFPDLRKGPIENYFKLLNPSLEMVYRYRKDFEDSVAILNENIAEILQEADEDMQTTLPHYFEKYQTDGVEYNIYLGQSILHHETFTNFHLRNFRIWQLIVMCDITRKVKALQQTMPQALTTAQLIFVYSDPLDIRFRLDEKHFDVDGAYNIRYEIIKKRIDKAYIQGTQERLTQSGKIAIVYLHNKDRHEYQDYLQYLAKKGYITPDIEELELGRLQGVEGLRALRVTVV